MFFTERCDILAEPLYALWIATPLILTSFAVVERESSSRPSSWSCCRGRLLTGRSCSRFGGLKSSSTGSGWTCGLTNSSWRRRTPNAGGHWNPRTNTQCMHIRLTKVWYRIRCVNINVHIQMQTNRSVVWSVIKRTMYFLKMCKQKKKMVWFTFESHMH